jgi:hypothetical protein
MPDEERSGEILDIFAGKVTTRDSEDLPKYKRDPRIREAEERVQRLRESGLSEEEIILREMERQRGTSSD